MENPTNNEQGPKLDKKKKAEQAALKRSLKKPNTKQGKTLVANSKKKSSENEVIDHPEDIVTGSEDDYLEAEPSEPEEELNIKKMTQQELKQRVDVLWKYIVGMKFVLHW